jgi:hypothetical protein
MILWVKVSLHGGDSLFRATRVLHNRLRAGIMGVWLYLINYQNG